MSQFTSERLKPFGTTIFSEMTALAVKHGAVNLGQGFPDFDGPEIAKQAAMEAIVAGEAQYARSFGLPKLNAAIAKAWQARTGFAIDPDTQVTVTSGCTEAIPSAILGLLNAGDEAILFSPFYDSYPACVALAGATPKFVHLRPPPTEDAGVGTFWFDPDDLKQAFTPRTRVVILNTPHNPTGKVFSRAELELIAEQCRERDVLVIADEVYERLTYEPALPHVSIATLPGMIERTVTLSSLGKTYNLTGWKIGWAVASPMLSKAVRAAHQFLTFATATPLQHGAAAIIERGEPSIKETCELFRGNRDRLAQALLEMGFIVHRSDGTYFLMVDHSRVGQRMGIEDDRAFCKMLTERVGVCAIPPSVFYHDPELGKPLARFAYCKKAQTIDAAIARLRGRLG